MYTYIYISLSLASSLRRAGGRKTGTFGDSCPVAVLLRSSRRCINSMYINMYTYIYISLSLSLPLFGALGAVRQEHLEKAGRLLVYYEAADGI